jgi:hypothetical protein
VGVEVGAEVVGAELGVAEVVRIGVGPSVGEEVVHIGVGNKVAGVVDVGVAVAAGAEIVDAGVVHVGAEVGVVDVGADVELVDAEVAGEAVGAGVTAPPGVVNSGLTCPQDAVRPSAALTETSA